MVRHRSRALFRLFPSLLLAACGAAAAEPDPLETELSSARAQQEPPAQEPEDDRYRIPFEDEDVNVFDQAALDARVAVISPRVAQLRGLEWEHAVLAGVHTPEQFVEFARTAFAEEFEDGKLKAMGVSLALFGFLPEGTDFEVMLIDMLKSMVGGYYDPKTSTFYMISTFNQGMLADFIMAHELGHALDDQHYPLMPFLERAAGSADREFASTCVVEGSAQAVGNMYLVRGGSEGWLDGGFDLGLMFSMLEGLEDVPPYLLISMTLPYTLGNSFLVRSTSPLAGAMIAPSDEDLVRAFDDPPTSSEQILHPEKYWDEESFDPPTEVALPDRSSELGEGWRSAEEETLGELGCAVLVMKRVPSAIEVSAGGGNFVQPASSGWDGDRFRLYVHAEHGAAMEWRTVWDSEEDATEFMDALEDVVRERVGTLNGMSQSGSEVRVVFASSGAEARAAAARLLR